LKFLGIKILKVNLTKPIAIKMKTSLIILLSNLIFFTPILKFNSKSHHFSVKLGETLNAEVEFVNNGDENLLIKNISSTCTCTIGAFSKESIEPKKTGFVQITFHSIGKRLGLQKQPLIIEINSVKKRFIKLELEFDVIK